MRLIDYDRLEEYAMEYQERNPRNPLTRGDFKLIDSFLFECTLMNDISITPTAQEPRVMTYDELATFDGAFLLESSDISELNWVFFFDADSKSDAIWVEGFDGERYVVYREDYATYTRCWTTRPTDEQREKTPWEEGDARMKAKKQIITTQDIDIDITDVTLLSIEEYEANKNIIPPIHDCWWLRSPGGDSGNVANVYDDGYVNDDNVDYDNNVRPVVALRLSESATSNLDVGGKIEMAGHTWTMLRDGLALCDDVVGCTEFRKDGNAKDANAYEVSDIKKWLEKWAVENGIEVQK